MPRVQYQNSDQMGTVLQILTTPNPDYPSEATIIVVVGWDNGGLGQYSLKELIFKGFL